jgi:hypothetical protein
MCRQPVGTIASRGRALRPTLADHGRSKVALVFVFMIQIPTAHAGGPPTTPHDRLVKYLADHPGGEAVNDNEISYGGGVFVVTLRPLGALGVPDCPSGWYCFYDKIDFGYPRGKLSACGRQDLANWGWQYRIESAHYNMSAGYVVFYYNDLPLFSVGVDNRTLSDVDPYRNLATVMTAPPFTDRRTLAIFDPLHLRRLVPSFQGALAAAHANIQPIITPQTVDAVHNFLDARPWPPDSGPRPGPRPLTFEQAHSDVQRRYGQFLARGPYQRPERHNVPDTPTSEA